MYTYNSHYNMDLTSAENRECISDLSCSSYSIRRFGRETKYTTKQHTTLIGKEKFYISHRRHKQAIHSKIKFCQRQLQFSHTTDTNLIRENLYSTLQSFKDLRVLHIMCTELVFILGGFPSLPICISTVLAFCTPLIASLRDGSLACIGMADNDVLMPAVSLEGAFAGTLLQPNWCGRRICLTHRLLHRFSLPWLLLV